ncbi:MAG TPA: DUF4931 domain-containing protein, partial [Candidatus Saccharimonadales bacterium]|nr:DUF4931 domain-containing protein [Candidatus Saccharimonadales bacterium]
MPDFQFLKDFSWNKWVILDPRRSKRPKDSKNTVKVCPFCVGNESADKELYRIGGNAKDSNWEIRVIPNKFPFAPVHELIIHSPDHHKNIDELPLSHVELLFQTFRARSAAHLKNGQVYLFHNRGELAGESIPHPHTQLVAIPKEVTLEIRP